MNQSLIKQNAELRESQSTQINTLRGEGGPFEIPSCPTFFKRQLYKVSSTQFKTIEKRFFCSSAATVYGQHLNVLMSNNTLTSGGYSYSRNWPFFAVKELAASGIKTQRVFNEGSAFVLGMTSHYGHFFIDTLDRSFKQIIPDVKYIVIDKLDSLSERLVQLYFPDIKGDLVSVDTVSSYAFDRLYWYSGSSAKPYMSFDTIRLINDFTHNHFPRDASSESRLKLFLTRQSASKRKILNGHQIRAILEKRQFEAIDLAFTTPQEQIKLFRQASVVVLPLGTEMYNLCYCESGTQVYALVNFNYLKSRGDSVYILRSICAALSLRLVIIGAESNGGAHDDDIFIHGSDLEKVIQPS